MTLEDFIKQLEKIEFRLANIQIQYTHTTLAKELNDPIIWVRKLKERLDNPKANLDIKNGSE